MELIRRYFPEMDESQVGLLEKYAALLLEWNQKINLISRQDTEHFFLHHILHSLAIAKWISFSPGTQILDLGTGGGLPGIPLAIVFPEAELLLVDARNKKILAVNAMIEALGLKNVTARHGRAEELKRQFDFVVSRAVSDLSTLKQWADKLIHHKHKNVYPNGLIIFKGGNLEAELKALPKKSYYEVIAVSRYFNEPYFEEKWLVYVQG
jgi:16S rRNA (guanine527-N7)-methyltransferase